MTTTTTEDVFTGTQAEADGIAALWNRTEWTAAQGPAAVEPVGDNTALWRVVVTRTERPDPRPKWAALWAAVGVDTDSDAYEAALERSIDLAAAAGFEPDDGVDAGIAVGLLAGWRDSTEPAHTEGWHAEPAGVFAHYCGACGQGHDGHHDCDLDPRHEAKAMLDKAITEHWTALGGYPCEASWCAAEGTERTPSSERYCPDHFARLGDGLGFEQTRRGVTERPNAWSGIDYLSDNGTVRVTVEDGQRHLIRFVPNHRGGAAHALVLWQARFDRGPSADDAFAAALSAAIDGLT